MNDRNTVLKERLLELDTAAVSDAMDSLGINRALFGIIPRVKGAKIAGPAFTVQYEAFKGAPSSFQNAGNYIDEVPAHSVIVVNNDGNTACTNWGDILTRKALHQNIAGTIINGSARDLETIRKLGYPIYTKGIFMVSGKNRVRVKVTNVSVDIDGVTVSPGDWLFADDNGVVVVHTDQLQAVIERAENVKSTEIEIVKAIAAGQSLAGARKNFGYSTPWIRKNDK